jgi:hypothetical protein
MTIRTPPTPLAYTLNEITQATGGIGLSKIKELIAAGELPIVKIDKRTLVLHEDLHALLARNRVTRGNGAAAVPPDQGSSSAPAPPPPTAESRSRRVRQK